MTGKQSEAGGFNDAFTRRGIAVVLLIVVFSIVVAAFALRSIRHTARAQVASTLVEMLDATSGVLQFWENGKRHEVESWAGDAGLSRLAMQLRSGGHAAAQLAANPAQVRLRSMLAPEMSQFGYDGYWLIDANGVALASRFDAGLGMPVPVPALNHELRRLFAGETLLFLAADNAADSSDSGTLFVAAPVRDAGGECIAALAFMLRPEGDFSRMARIGRSGKSGETYLFDADARLLSGSRFEPLLSSLGLSGPVPGSASKLRLIDPGVDLQQAGQLPADYHRRPLTRMAASATEGNDGMNLDGYDDYRGVPVVGAWRWFPGKDYGLAAEIDVDEAYDMFGSMRTILFGVLLAMILVFMVMVFLTEKMHRRTADVLGASEARYRQLFNLIPDAIAVHSGGSISYCNPAAVKMFAASTEAELLGRPVLDLVHPDDRQRVQQRILRGLQQGGLQELEEERLLRIDGSAFTAEVEGCRFADTDGQDAMLVVARDISARKQVEEERERLRIAVEQSPEGVYITDARGVILYVNQSAERISGRTQEELLGMYAAEVRGGRVGDRIYREIVDRLNAGSSWNGEFNLRRPDGMQRIIERRTSPVIVDGQTHYHVSVDRDITDERQQQEQMEHTQRLESLGVLAGGIAHDFNNILAAIMGNASLALNKFGDHPDAAKHLSRIEVASQRAAELCRQMLAYSGKGRFVVKPVNLSLLLQDIAKLLEVSVTKHAELHIDLVEDLPAVQADATQLQQVIMNLVINASDAIGERSGHIHLSTGKQPVAGGDLQQSYTGEPLAAGDYVFLEVRDDGCGMSEETRKKLFDPFYTTKFTGRGLGMSAVLGIVRGHHGAILVDSVEGEGSCFKVLLPVTRAGSGGGADEQDESIDWCPTGTVLVVDDEQVVRETARMMIEDIGFQALEASDGEEAVEVYRQHCDEIDLVLLDMTMPRMDGRTCFHKLRELNPAVRVVLSSGYTEQEATNAFDGDVLNGFVQKPYRVATLRAMLREVVEEMPEED